jgi:hypothetical protein
MPLHCNFPSFHQSRPSVPWIYGTGLHPVLWAGSRDARGKITVVYITDQIIRKFFSRIYINYICGRGPHNTALRAAGWRPTFYTVPRFLLSAVLVGWWNKRPTLSTITRVDSFVDSGFIRPRGFLRSLIFKPLGRTGSVCSRHARCFFYLLLTVLSSNSARENVIRFSSWELYWSL